jgi:ribonuclease HI
LIWCNYFPQRRRNITQKSSFNRGSILLAEIIAIKIVLEYFINSQDQELHNITIFSDSQSALGILTLNWKSENYFQSINEIKSQINYPKEQGVVVSFNWTPGHASIKGNEIADQLAKEAAKEAEALELNTQVFTKQDIRKTARDVVTINGK